MKYNVSILEFIFSMFKISWFIFQFFTLIFSEPLNLFRKVKGVRIIDLSMLYIFFKSVKCMALLQYEQPPSAHNRALATK